MNSVATRALLGKAPPLEMIELEMALAVQDVLASGFGDTVRNAAQTIGGEVLFDMPMVPGSQWQRIAAVSAGYDDQAQVLLVMLGADGLTMQVEDAGYSSNPFAGFARTHVEMLMHMASSNLPCVEGPGSQLPEQIV